MYIDRLALLDFRNYISLDIKFPQGCIILVGPNAQGKSAILEAIYALATSKSHRTSRDNDLIRLGFNATRVFGGVKRVQRPDVELEIILNKAEKKTVKINRSKRAKIGDLVGQLNAVIFSIVDIEMAKGEPSAKRRFLNLEISQVSPQYIYAFGRYKKVLEQRNKLLKDGKNGHADMSMLHAWDAQLSLYGAMLIEKRSFFCKRLSEISSEVYLQLTSGKETLSVRYDSNIDISDGFTQQEIASAFSQKLSRLRSGELMRGTTLCGPQRDDLTFLVNGLDIRNFGSQGQQRTVALAVKLAEIQVIEEYAGEPPIVLLDDVTAELDEERRSHVFDLTFGKCQTFVTTTTLKDLDKSIVDKSTIFFVKAGEITTK